jgi:hypothetical protein
LRWMSARRELGPDGLVGAGQCVEVRKVRIDGDVAYAGLLHGFDDSAGLQLLLAPWCPLNRNRGDARWRSDRLVGSKFRIVPQRLSATVASDRSLGLRLRQFVLPAGVDCSDGLQKERDDGSQ